MRKRPSSLAEQFDFVFLSGRRVDSISLFNIVNKVFYGDGCWVFMWIVVQVEKRMGGQKKYIRGTLFPTVEVL